MDNLPRLAPKLGYRKTRDRCTVSPYRTYARREDLFYARPRKVDCRRGFVIPGSIVRRNCGCGACWMKARLPTGWSNLLARSPAAQPATSSRLTWTTGRRPTTTSTCSPRHRSCKSSSCGESDITDAGVDHLLPLADLEDLELQNTRITDAGLAKLGALKKLKSLDLQRATGITDDGMA